VAVLVGDREWPILELVFAIISKSTNPLEIPFFSKVSLKNARRRLQGYGYKVTKKKIQRQPPNTAQRRP
jgi:uncharacterized protein (TIGR04141 family)